MHITRQREVSAIKANQELVRSPKLGECVQNTLLLSNFPDECFMTYGMMELEGSRKLLLTTDKSKSLSQTHHTTLPYNGDLLGYPSRCIFLVKAHSPFLNPVKETLPVSQSPLLGDDSFEDDEAISSEIVSPVSKMLVEIDGKRSRSRRLTVGLQIQGSYIVTLKLKSRLGLSDGSHV